MTKVPVDLGTFEELPKSSHFQSEVKTGRFIRGEMERLFTKNAMSLGTGSRVFQTRAVAHYDIKGIKFSIQYIIGTEVNYDGTVGKAEPVYHRFVIVKSESLKELLWRLDKMEADLKPHRSNFAMTFFNEPGDFRTEQKMDTLNEFNAHVTKVIKKDIQVCQSAISGLSLKARVISEHKDALEELGFEA